MKKRVLFLINTLSGGGAEKVLVDVVNNLNPDKYDITLYTLTNKGIYHGSLKEHVNYKSIDSCLKNKYLKKILRGIVAKLLPHRMIYKLFIKNNYDVEIAFLEGKPTKILSYSNNPNKIAWVHLDLWNFYNGLELVYNSVEEHTACYKKYKSIYCVSQSAKEGFKKRFGLYENVYVQYNPLDENTVIELANEELNEIDIPAKLKLVTVGRLTEQKGYDRLLRVANKLKNSGYDFVLWILGEGEKRSELEEFIEANSLNDNVKLLGFQKNPYKYMRNADLFICSSYAEGFSLVLAEALICSTPCISTYCSGPNEILQNGKYGLMTENDEDSLYDGIKKLLDSPELMKHYRECALERGRRFSLRTRMNEIEEIIDNA